MPELADWPPAQTEIARLEEQHRCLVEDLADAALRIGHHWVFDIATGQKIGDSFPSLGPFSAVSVSPDGTTLITGDGAGMMRWDIDSDRWRTTACAVAGRNLTRAEWAQYLPNSERYRATCPEPTGSQT